MLDCDKDTLLQKLQKASPPQQETIYVMIRSHQLQNGTVHNCLALPYNGKRMKRGIKFDLDKFPDELLYKLQTLFLT